MFYGFQCVKKHSQFSEVIGFRKAEPPQCTMSIKIYVCYIHTCPKLQQYHNTTNDITLSLNTMEMKPLTTSKHFQANNKPIHAHWVPHTYASALILALLPSIPPYHEQQRTPRSAANSSSHKSCNGVLKIRGLTRKVTLRLVDNHFQFFKVWSAK
jgi:hypothetical protein